MNSVATEVLDGLDRWPRLRLAALPTRLVLADGVRRSLGRKAPEILVKMDAETGFGLGGNKVRKLEYELSRDRLEGVTHLITTGGPQSNHCRVTAAAAAHLGLGCVLVLNGEEPTRPQGNALLHRLFGADIHMVPDREARAPAMAAAEQAIADVGGRALVVPLGASTGLGALGYVQAAREMVRQIDTLPKVAATRVFVSASSCGTLAGLLLGFALLGRDDVRLVGVSADVTAAGMEADTLRLAREAADLLGWGGSVTADRLSCDDGHIGEGYGIATPGATEAIALFGAREGVALDPVYTGKAAAGMLEWIRRGDVPANHRVVFVHTGGHPALFA